MKPRHQGFLVLTALLSIACFSHDHTSSPTEPSAPTLPRIAGDYAVRLFFFCKTDQDLPTWSTERITIVQDGASFTATLPRSGMLRGTVRPNALVADVTYTFDPSLLSICPCAINAVNGSGNFVNAQLQGIAFSQGTATHCQFGNFSIVFERMY